LSQLCWRRAFPHTSREGPYPPLNRGLYTCCGFPEVQIRLHPLLNFETPEYCCYPSHQPGRFSLLPVNLHLTSTTTHRTATLVTWVSSRLEHRAFNATDKSKISALQTEISNSPQSFNVVLDTGSADLWVTDTGCTTCPQSTPNFSPNTSTTFQASQGTSGQLARVTITYGSGSVTGDLVRDAVAMGGFRVPQQSWLLVDQISANLLDGSNAGILGLAFSTIANTQATPFWETLAEGGQLTTPEMSFWFTRFLGSPTAQAEEFGGIFTLGGQNQTLYKGDIEFLPLVTNAGRQTYWLLTVSGTYRFRPYLTPWPFSCARLNYRDHCQWKERQFAVWRRRCYRYWYDTHRRPRRRSFSTLRPDSRLSATDW